MCKEMVIQALRLPVEMWADTPEDQQQRYSRYLDAAQMLEFDGRVIDLLRAQLDGPTPSGLVTQLANQFIDEDGAMVSNVGNLLRLGRALANAVLADAQASTGAPS